MENSKNTGYILHDFMMKEMGLDGVALKVYALIYSFTKAGSNCYGSVRYIGERTDSAKSSVHRALNELLEKGYIYKLENNDGKTSRYTANLDPLSQNGTTSVPNLDWDVPKSDTPSPKIGHNNKDNNKPHNTTTTNNTYSLRRGGKPLVTMGNKKMLLLTLHEYANLLRVLGVVPTRRYMRNLENRIISHPRYNYDNHYQTIIDWARKDGYVVPAEQ